jgi:hypothetical protein
MTIHDEAEQRYPSGDPVSLVKLAEQSAFVVGAEWARKEALREAEETAAALLVDPALLADPTIYASAATDALTSAQTALHALRSDTEGEQP